MNVVLLGLGIVALAFGVHILVWRIRLPRRQTKALLAIFLGALAVGLCLAAFWPSAHALAPDDIWGQAHVALFVLAVMGAYVITYTAVEADSPTLVMVMLIRAAGPEGLDRKVFAALLTDELLVLPRLRDMVRDGTAIMEGGRYRLTAKGRRFARIFGAYRRLLGGEMGG